MKIKNYIQYFSIFIIISSVLLLIQGCATKIPWCDFLQRSPVRVVIMPSINKTEHPDAPVIFNKACEEAMKKKGFVVISADRVITYASSRGLLLNDVTNLKASELGKDLQADMVLYSEIDIWESQYAVLNTRVEVAGISKLVETSTDALVWRYNWDFIKDSSDNNNNGLVGLLVNAAVDAVANAAFDACSSLGTQAGAATVTSMPHPGFAPADSKPRQTAR